MMAESPGALSVSPVGPLTDAGSRKTLIYLILTLNHMYPDYDFSALRGHHFTKENAVPASALGSGAPPHVMRVKNDVDGLLLETAKAYEATVGAGAEPLSSELWRAIDAAIRLVDCDVYTYKAVAEGDPFCDDGNLWSFNYFFYNRKLKRILYFSCRAVSKTADEESDFEDGEDALGPMDDSFLADGMEMDDDDILPADPLAPDPDDALTSQMFGPLSPNPAAPIQLPEHEWLDMLGGHGAAGVGGGGGVDPIVGKLEPRVGVGGPLIRSASQDDDVGAEGSADPFVSSILDRGPSLEKQMSLGFLERMSSAEIGDMVKDMNINQPFDDEFARRVREIKS